MKRDALKVAGDAAVTGERKLDSHVREFSIGGFGTLLASGIAQLQWARRLSFSTNGSVILLQRRRKIGTGLLVAIVHKSPSANYQGENDDYNNSDDGELFLVLTSPGDSFDSGLSERVLFQLMSSRTAHGWSLVGFCH